MMVRSQIDRLVFVDALRARIAHRLEHPLQHDHRKRLATIRLHLLKRLGIEICVDEIGLAVINLVELERQVEGVLQKRLQLRDRAVAVLTLKRRGSILRLAHAREPLLAARAA